jgi:hypothetical protein
MDRVSDRAVIALVGDVVASRRIEERLVFNAGLLHTIDRLNQRNPDLLSPYTITLGDEIQAVFGQAYGIFADAAVLLAAVYPHRMRFSYGVGKLVTPINPDQAIGMDGPAFYHARDGIDRLKKEKRLFHVAGDHLPRPELLNHALYLIAHNMAGWNETRWKTLPLLYDGLSPQEIAGHMNLTDQAIYKTIRSGALYEIIALFSEIEAAINDGLRGSL